jgi:hypothetical protein
VAPGYTLFSPFGSGFTFLMDENEKIVHTWESQYSAGCAWYLLDNGNLLRCANEPEALFKAGGEGGRIQEFSWQGELVWDWTHATKDYWLHHDVEQLPNGNILAIAWEKKTAQEANAAGRRPELIPQAGIWPDKIIEIKPEGLHGGRIVWEWHVWDHLIQDYDETKANYGDPAAHPELVNINADEKPRTVNPEELARLKALGYVPADAKAEDLGPDLMHTNAVDYNADLDQIVISVKHLGEIWIIDHSTTTDEAAGHSGGRWGKGGDLLYRWGNPKNYNRGTDQDRQLFGQHDVFNNNVPGPAGEHSEVHVFEPPTREDGSYVIPETGTIGPSGPVWRYSAPDPTSFHSSYISGARRLSNGNTLICEGDDGRFFEVSPEGAIVWEYREPFSGRFDVSGPGGLFPFSTFRVSKIPPDAPALRGRILKPLDPQPQTEAEKAGITPK